MNTVPDSGSRTPAASWDLAKARAKPSSSPIASPVDRISGPGTTSTAGKRADGKTASLTATRPLRPPCSPPIRSRSFAPAMTRAAAMRAGAGWCGRRRRRWLRLARSSRRPWPVANGRERRVQRDGAGRWSAWGSPPGCLSPTNSFGDPLLPFNPPSHICVNQDTACPGPPRAIAFGNFAAVRRHRYRRAGARAAAVFSPPSGGERSTDSQVRLPCPAPGTQSPSPAPCGTLTAWRPVRSIKAWRPALSPLWNRAAGSTHSAPGQFDLDEPSLSTGNENEELWM